MSIGYKLGLVLAAIIIFGAGYYVALHGLPWVGSSDTATTSGTGAVNSDATSQAATPPAGSVEIKTTSLTDGQRQLLKSLGIDANSVTVTPAMLNCAESAVGAVRLEEIKGGATPSFTEGVKLFACYTKG